MKESDQTDKSEVAQEVNHNRLPASTRPDVTYDYEMQKKVCAVLGLDPSRIISLELSPNKLLIRVMESRGQSTYSYNI